MGGLHLFAAGIVTMTGILALSNGNYFWATLCFILGFLNLILGLDTV